MKRTLLTYLYLVVAISVEIYAQIHYEPTIGLSPEVSRFSEFGDVPVSLYTGIPKIEIPLHEIKIGTHTIPIRLHYIGGGIKPDEHPGWLGLGWALKIGGCITRTVNGYPDEYYNPVTLGKVGYYYNFSSNVSSSDISNLDNCLLNVAKQAHDNAPDKFSFSFLDYNGNFYLSNTGEWVVQCDRPVKIIFDGTEDSFTRKYSETSTSFSLQGTNADLVGRSHHFKKFTIMGEDGTRYIFGGSDSAIEYSVNMFNQISDQMKATAWHLTKIIYPDSHEINFYYAHGEYIAQLYTNDYMLDITTTSASGDFLNSISGVAPAIPSFGYLIMPCYLMSINCLTSNIYFSKSSTNELPYKNLSVIGNSHASGMADKRGFMPILANNGHYNSNEKGFPECLDALKWTKLSEIQVYEYNPYTSSSSLSKAIKFDYTDTVTQRLILNSVSIVGRPSNEDVVSFRFEYNNQELLPHYLSNMTDHWGFYNANVSPRVHNPEYGKSREPNISTTGYGSLSKVIYPTGGYTRFIYEPHDYSAKVTASRNGVINMSLNSYSGGIRIKRINNSPTGKYEDEYTTKEYFYVTDYLKNRNNATQSSGILTQLYQYQHLNKCLPTVNYEGGKAIINTYQSMSLLPAIGNMTCNHIEYREVVEKNADGSFSIYKYTNFSDGHADEPALATLYDQPPVYEPSCAKDQERGLLKNMSQYDSSGKLKKQYVYEYEKSDSSSSNNVIIFRTQANVLNNMAYLQGTAYRAYIYVMKLRQISEHSYEDNRAFSKVRYYKYNSNGLIENIRQSKDDTFTNTSYRYADSFTSESSGKYLSMMESHRLSPVVEEIHCMEKPNGDIIQLKKTRYHYTDNIVSPTSVSVAHGNNEYETLISYRYDCYGNIIEKIPRNAPSSHYVWSNKGTRLYAIIRNNSYSVINSILNTFDRYSSLDNPEQSCLTQLINHASCADIETIAYSSVGKIEKITYPNGKEIQYRYDSLERLTAVLDSDGNIIETFRYNIAGSVNSNYISHALFTDPVSDAENTTTSSQAIITTEFYNGLGQKTQNVTHDIIPGHYLADYYEYDSRGNVSVQWLPTVGIGNGIFTPLDELLTSYGDTYPNDADYPYRTIYYDGSVENRVAEMCAPGIAWQESIGKCFGYHISSAANMEYNIPNYTIDTTGELCRRSDYDGRLRISELTDEDGHRTLYFYNNIDSLVAERRITNAGFVDTHYIYDNMGNLRYVLPPMASEALKNIIDYPGQHPVIDKYAYVYEYDYRNRLISRKLPSQKPIYYVYDRSDLMRMSQDGNQRERNEWTTYTYDTYFRLVITAKATSEESVSSLRNRYAKNSLKARYNGADGNILGYSVIMPNYTEDDVMTVNYYDNYSYLSIFTEAKDSLMYRQMADYDAKYVNTQQQWRSSMGALTGSAVKVLGDSMLIVSAIYYNRDGNIVQKHESNIKGGWDREFYRLSFTGLPEEIRYEHSVIKESHYDIVRYSYDNHLRMVDVEMSHNGETFIQLCRNSYNNLGQLSSQIIGNNLTKTNYGYNVRGWLNSISNPWYSQRLYYDTNRDGSTASLCGNLNAQSWEMNYHYGSAGLSGVYSGAYDYNYDELDRIMNANYTEFYRKEKRKDEITFTDVAFTSLPDYSTDYTYDLQGNATSIVRHAVDDKLAMTCDSVIIEYSGNQMVKLRDVSGNTLYGGQDIKDKIDKAIEYNYDSNGNMISDLNRSICSVSYNELNLPQHISFTNGYAIDYIYDAIGRKLKTIYSIDYRTVFSPEELENLPEDEEAVEIILMREYCGRYTYSDGKIERIETDNGFINSTGNYNYYIKDYQGNIHITLQHDGTMLDRSMYYPYGSGFYDMNSRSGRFQFAGKELDKMQNLNMYDFGARFYDPSLGRFSTSDPLCERHYGVSPYLYCAGNPNKYNDPLGLDWISAQFDNHIFIFFDNRVESVDDITNNYGRDLENWTYLGDNGQIVIGSKMDGSTITIGLGQDGSFSINGVVQTNEYDSSDIHVGNAKTTKAESIMNNFYGNYLGSNNPMYNEDIYSYAVPPINALDYAAFLHDRAYDRLGANGLADAIFNTDLIEADIQFIRNIRTKNNFNSKYFSRRFWSKSAYFVFYNIALFKAGYNINLWP